MTDKTYSVIEFRAENFKRLSAVAIKPSGNIVEITGENGAGKTSVLDALWACMAGAKAIQTDPIRKGEEKAIIVTDLGDLKVTRRFTRQDPKETGVNFTTTLTVENADGFHAKTPQNMLNALFGALTFDPLDFKEKEPPEQLEMLRQFVPDVDFAAIDRANAEDYRERTDLNRRAKDLKAQAEGIEVPEVEGDLIDLEALDAQFDAAHEHNGQVAMETARRSGLRDLAATRTAEVAALEKRIDALLAEVRQLKTDMGKAQDAVLKIEVELDTLDPIPDPIEVAGIREELTQARSHNMRLGTAKKAEELRAKLLKETEISVAKAQELTERMETRTAAKQEAIAKAKMPVDGLGFGDGYVTLNDVPFDQASDAEQLRTSVAIAMALNPKLKVIRIRDGSLLSEKSMKVLSDMVSERGYQCWIETVNSDRPGAILIEDGHVVSSAELKPQGALI